MSDDVPWYLRGLYDLKAQAAAGTLPNPVGHERLANLAAGPARAASGSLGLLGAVGVPGATEVAEAIDDTTNNALGVSNARWDTDPRAAFEQTFGASMLVAPGATSLPYVGRLAAAAPAGVKMAGRALEAITPVTFGATPANVALNFGAGTVLGAGMEQAANYVTANAPERVAASFELPDMPATDRLTSTATGVAGSSHAPAVAASFDIAQNDQSQAEPGVAASFEVNTPEPLTTGEKVLSWAPIVLGGMAVGGGAWAAAQGIRRSVASNALAGSIVSPGRTPDPDVFIPNLGQRIANNVTDEGSIARVPVTEAMKQGHFTPDRAEVLYSTIDVGTNRVARQTQADSFEQTGILPNGMRIGRSDRERMDEFAGLTNNKPETAAAVQRATAAMDELANRHRAQEEGKYTPDGQLPNAPLVPMRKLDTTTGQWHDDYAVTNDPKGNVVFTALQTPEPARVGITDRSFMDLHKELADLQNHPIHGPDVRRFMEEEKKVNRAWGTEMVRSGYRSQSDVDKMLSRNPYYRHTLDPEDVANNPFTMRDIRQGAMPDRAQDVFQARLDAHQQYIPIMEHNKAKVDYFMSIKDAQDSGVYGKTKFVGRLLDPDDVTNVETVSFRLHGQRKKIEVFVPEIAAVMRNRPKDFVPVMNGFRKFLQYMTTGPGAAVFGPVFAHVSAAYNATTGLATRKLGTSAGYIDKGVQHLSGGRFGFRADPTFVGHAIYRIAADGASVVAREMGAFMRRFDSTKHLGDQLAKQYEQSFLAQMGRAGAGNTGGAYAGDYATRSRADIGGVSPRYDAARPLGDGTVSWKDLRGLQDKARERLTTYMPVPVRKGWQLYKEALDIIANSPASAYWAENIRQYERKYGGPNHNNLPSQDAERALARRTRQLGADPSISGAARSVQMTTSTMPYSNLMLQSFGTYGKAFRENPTGTLTSIAMMSTFAAYATVMSAVHHDEERIANGLPPEAVNDMLFGDTNTMAGKAKVYIPGTDITMMPQIPLEPFMAPATVAMRWLMVKQFGLDDPRFFTEDYKQDREVLASMLDDASSKTWWKSFQRGFTQFSVPPPIELAGRAAGKDLREMFTLGAGRISDASRRNVQGFDEGVIRDDPLHRSVHDIFETFGGASGAVALQGILTGAVVARDKGIMAAAHSMREVRSMAVDDRLSVVAPLWKGPGRITGYDVNAEVLGDLNSKLDHIKQNMRDISEPGVVGAGNRRMLSPFTEGPQPPPDTIVPVLQAFAQFRDRPDIKDNNENISTQRRLIEELRSNSTRLMEPREVRRLENAYNDESRRINAESLRELHKLERQLSDETGYEVRLDALNPRQGIEQFRRRSP